MSQFSAEPQCVVSAFAGLTGVAQIATPAPLLPPMGIVALCVLAAIGIALLLPSRRGNALRRIGGALALVAGLVFAVLVGRLVDKWAWGGDTGVYFWAFSGIAILSAVRVVTHPRPVYSALYFVMTVFASAGLFVMLWAEFMAAALVLIYAGAVLVTYVFVIMLAAESSGGTGETGATTGTAGLPDADRFARDPFLAGAIAFTLLGLLLVVIFDKTTPASTARLGQAAPFGGEVIRVGAFSQSPEVKGDTQRLGAYLYQHQALAVQLAMLLLTLAMVGAVIIARRKVFLPPELAHPVDPKADILTTPATPNEDNPHTIPVYGTNDPSAKSYPET
jgi:NADH-quinone oxidoreductase subunit J